MTDAFWWGVAQSAYPTEGGLDTVDGPHTNRYRSRRPAETPPGAGLGFWADPLPLLESAAATGADTIVLGVEWARVEPRPGDVEVAALDGYADIVRACRRLGLEPVLALGEATWPRWLGLDAWIGPGASTTLDAWCRHARTVADGLAQRLAATGDAPVARWLTWRRPNQLAADAYLVGRVAPGRRADLRAAQACLDTLASAHVLATSVLRDASAAAGADSVWISVELATVGLYDWCWRLADVWTARRRGVAVSELADDLAARRDEFADEVARSPHLHPAGAATAAEHLLTGAGAARFAPPLERCVAAVYASDADPGIDALTLAVGDDAVSHWLRVPGRRTGALGGRRRWSPRPAPWESRVVPAAMRWTIRRGAERALPLLVIDRGLATDADRPRADGWRRPAYLDARCAAVDAAIRDDATVVGYVYGALADAWEDGGTRIRRGLCATPDTAHADTAAVRPAPVDALGDPAPAAFARHATGTRGVHV